MEICGYTQRMRHLVPLVFVAAAVVGVTGVTDASAQQGGQKAWLGVGIQNVANGVLVSEVIDGAPADDAGLKQGDVITKVDNVAVRTTNALVNQIARRRVGSAVQLTIVRAGRTTSVRAMLDRRLNREELLNRRLLAKLAPDFNLNVMTRAGVKGKVRLSSLRGKVVVLEFWSRYCGYCKLVHPALSKLQRKHKQNLVVLGLADDPAAALRAHLAKPANAKGINFTTLHDSGSAIKRVYHVQSTPTIIVIDNKGVVRFVGLGAGRNAGNAINMAEHCVKNPHP